MLQKLIKGSNSGQIVLLSMRRPPMITLVRKNLGYLATLLTCLSRDFEPGHDGATFTIPR